MIGIFGTTIIITLVLSIPIYFSALSLIPKLRYVVKKFPNSDDSYAIYDRMRFQYYDLKCPNFRWHTGSCYFKDCLGDYPTIAKKYRELVYTPKSIKSIKTIHIPKEEHNITVKKAPGGIYAPGQGTYEPKNEDSNIRRNRSIRERILNTR
jgi:hypothetical protein